MLKCTSVCVVITVCSQPVSSHISDLSVPYICTK